MNPEKVKVVNGITYVSHAASTDAKMTAQAIEAMERPLVWIVCVKKGVDYSPLRCIARKKITSIIFCGTESEDLIDYFFNDVELFVRAETMDEAALIASYCCYRGESVLFSPCTKNHLEFFKGADPDEAYKNAVNKLQE